MISLDTCKQITYSPLIPAMRTICEAPLGETIEIIMDNKEAFNDLKEYLSEQSVGFREVYMKDRMILQFKKK
ncbi:MAG: sulfurtransferase TusA family protein [Bacteroidaceae bacterium]|nr:sulfurtransferase TusA family protein [Bacteroidaceae bacterium]